MISGQVQKCFQNQQSILNVERPFSLEFRLISGFLKALNYFELTVFNEQSVPKIAFKSMLAKCCQEYGVGHTCVEQDLHRI